MPSFLPFFLFLLLRWAFFSMAQALWMEFLYGGIFAMRFIPLQQGVSFGIEGFFSQPCGKITAISPEFVPYYGYYFSRKHALVGGTIMSPSMVVKRDVWFEKSFPTRNGLPNVFPISFFFFDNHWRPYREDQISLSKKKLKWVCECVRHPLLVNLQGLLGGESVSM